MPTTVPLAIFGLEGDFLTSPSVIGLSPERLIAYSKDLLDVIQGKSNGHARELMIENRAKTTVVYGVLGSLFRDLFYAVKEQDTVKDSGNSIEQFHRFLEELGKVYWDTIGKISGGIAPVVNEDVGQESKFTGNNIKIFKAQLQERFYSQAEKVVSYLKDRSKVILGNMGLHWLLRRMESPLELVFCMSFFLPCLLFLTEGLGCLVSP